MSEPRSHGHTPLHPGCLASSCDRDIESLDQLATAQNQTCRTGLLRALSRPAGHRVDDGRASASPAVSREWSSRLSPEHTLGLHGSISVELSCLVFQSGPAAHGTFPLDDSSRGMGRMSRSALGFQHGWVTPLHCHLETRVRGVPQTRNRSNGLSEMSDVASPCELPIFCFPGYRAHCFARCSSWFLFSGRLR